MHTRFARFVVVTSLFLSFWSKSYGQSSEVVVHLGLSPTGKFEAKTNQVEGSPVVEGQTIKAQNIRVPLKSLKTGIALRDEHMKNKYLQVEQYPYAILKFGEGQSGKGQGELEIGGITRPVQGEYRINGGQLEASFKIKLSDYRISGIRYMGVGVKDEARIEVRLPIKK